MKHKSNKDKLPVRVFREELGITRVELGRRIGISERSLADIESGNSIPKVETLVALARELGKSLKIMVQAVGIDTSGIPDDIPVKK